MPLSPLDNMQIRDKLNSASRATVRKADKKMVGLVVLLLLVGGGGFAGGVAGSNYHSKSSANIQRVVLNEGQLISTIAKEVGPSVVSVNVTSKSVQADPFGFSQPVSQQSAGTGFVISSSGIIITNRHVVPSGTSSVSVTLSDGTELKDVEVLGRTADSDPLDVAFLKIKNTQGKKLVPLRLGDSSKSQVGDKVIAIGNALGQFQNTVTSGIVSGFGRDIQAGDQGGSSSSETLQNLIQTDAAINEGNSGGPLVDMSGQVIGINTALAGGQAQNIGFSIPINDVQGLIKSVLVNGKLERPYLGIRYVSLTDDYAYRYNLPVKRGAYVAPSSEGGSSILSGSPAAKAGLQEKDIISKIDGVAIDDTHSLTSIVGSKSVGDKVSLTVIRDGKTLTLSATLAAMTGN